MEAALPEAGPQPVLVTVVGPGGVEPGMTVVYEDSMGAVLGSATTDVTGSASQLLATGSMVTVVLGDSTNPQLFTYMGVEPGDLLVVLDQTQPIDQEAQVTALPMPSPTGAIGYEMSAGPCRNGIGNLPGTLNLSQGTATPCVGIGPVGTGFGAVFPFLVEAYDDSSSLVGFTFQKQTALASADDAGLVTPALGNWLTGSALTTQTLPVVNGPDAQEDIQLSLSEVTDGVMFTTNNTGGTPNQVTTHVGYADWVQTEADTGNYMATVAVATRMAPPTADGSLPIDVSPLASAPQLTNLAGALDNPRQPIVSWTTSSGSLASMAGLVTTTQWGAEIDGGFQRGSWTIVAPASSAVVQAPALPAAASAWAPQDGANVNNVVVYGLQGSAIPNYAALRAAAPLIPFQNGCITTPVAPPLPAAGTVVVAVFTNAGCG